MKVGIFLRSTAGYLMVLFLLGGSNVYAILKLVQFNNIILESHIADTRLLDAEKRIVDALLSQMRYEQKFVLTKDPVLFDEFHAAKEEFDTLLVEISSGPSSETKRAALDKIRTVHGRYESLVEAEAKYLKEKKQYDRNWYKREKEKAADMILAELEHLEDYSREDFALKTKMVSAAGSAARQVAIGSFFVTILFAIVLSFFITRSITNPLMTLVNKTREVPTGSFDCDLPVSTPPEVLELQDAFKLMCDRLKEVDRIKAEFFAMISHELRTPLTTITEGTSLLREGVGGAITEKQERLLGIISAESKRLGSLVNSILDLSKMEAGMMSYSFEEARIAPLIEQAVGEIVPYAEAKGIRIEANAVSLQCRMDRERILEVLRNLIGNAVKFTPEGGRITVVADRTEEGLQVSVNDSGPGIAGERLTTIFEKYASTDQKKGTGLGLAIVKHIVTAHGGKVWAESTPGEGSRFIFVLPC